MLCSDLVQMRQGVDTIHTSFLLELATESSTFFAEKVLLNAIRPAKPFDSLDASSPSLEEFFLNCG